MQSGQPQIRKRHTLVLLRGTDNMALVFESATGQQHWKVPVAVPRPVAHAAAEHDQRVVENLCFLQPGNEVAELGGQEGLYYLELTDPVF